MIWLAWLALAIALAVAGWWAKSDLEYLRGLLLIAAGLVLVWAAAGVLSERAYWVFSALIWVVLAAYISTTGSGFSIISGLFLIGAGVLVLPARLSGASYEYGNPWLLGSDVLGVCAILALGWPIACDVSDRVGRMVSGDRPSGVAGGVSHRAGHQEAQD